MTLSDTVKVQLYLPKTDYDALKKISIERRIKPSALCREYVGFCIDKQIKKQGV